ncbi:MAG TPA: FecR domain-containing protein, partial [Sandaracinaceae bacterium]
MACLSAKTSVRPLNTDLRGGADESSALSGFAARWVSCLLLLACPAAALAERDCPNAWHGAVVAVEGLVELDTRSGWMAAHSGKVVCDGDIVRTGAFGRATVRLPDGTLMQIGPHSAIRITATESGTSSWPEVVVKVLKGVIHVITRDPRPLRYDTPFVNAGIEGTEFVVRVRPDGAAVTVIEGEVALTNAAGQASAKAGTKGTATFGTGPEVADDPAPLATIDWMRRFPPVLEGPLPAPDAAPTGAEAPSAVFYVRRAASRLAVGAAEEADGDLAAALAIDPDLGEALALQALLVLSNGERGRALELAEAAVEAAPNVSAGWLALSHAASAALDRTLARESAETATRVAPAHAYAWARLAELRFAAEDYSGARSAAAQAARLDPRLAAGHVVLGFAHLAGDSAAQAEAAFRAAIGVDAANPYSHLGLGLALYRQGEKDAARAEIEVAVGLDPTNPIIRSYAARVYDEENRDELAATVLDIAKALDAEDSTGLFY